jgi:hypothetical protein
MKRDPTLRFTITVKDLLALRALADERDQSVARLLRDLVRDATRKGKVGSEDARVSADAPDVGL